MNRDGVKETKSTSTAGAYCWALKRVAEIAGTDLVDLDVGGVNELMNAIANGTHPSEKVKEGGYSGGTMKQWQSAVTKFYEHHSELGVPPGEIAKARQNRNGTVDERDMYSTEEVQALRDACDNPRDRCLLELLLNTGQRIRAIQTLRIKDIDLDAGATGIYYLNTEVEGLKGAEKNSGKRPLLGARRAVYDWLQYHPKKDDSDSALITKRPSHNRGVAGEAIAQLTIRRALEKIADGAGIDKPPNPPQLPALLRDDVQDAILDGRRDDQVPHRPLGGQHDHGNDV